MAVEFGGDWHLLVGRLHAPAGKHQLACHELESGVAPAEQHLRRWA
jgi:hypothetical protein